MESRKVGVIGSGLIGGSWAMLFAAAGYKVSIYDTDVTQLHTGKENIKKQLDKLSSAGLLRGKLDARAQLELISFTNSLKDCIAQSTYIQECVPESLEIKRSVFEALDPLVGNDAILASSSSTIPASKFTNHLTHRQQVIVAHPTNPPFYCPLTEVVPAPYTADWVKTKTVDVLKELGQTPVLLKKEIPGFALNRIQYALLAECWRLLEEDAISVPDLDKVMTDGLGMRYAFMGPLQTCHLNAEGFLNYCDRYGETIYGITKSFGPAPEMKGPVMDKIAGELSSLVPLHKLSERRQWRDERLIELTKLKQKLN